MVRETPAMLGAVDVQGLVRDLADEIVELGEGRSLEERLAERERIARDAGNRRGDLGVTEVDLRGGHGGLRAIDVGLGGGFLGIGADQLAGGGEFRFLGFP